MTEKIVIRLFRSKYSIVSLEDVKKDVLRTIDKNLDEKLVSHRIDSHMGVLESGLVLTVNNSHYCLKVDALRDKQLMSQQASIMNLYFLDSNYEQLKNHEVK